jgi:AbrB family looped-hinge helix DNA binding protein
MVTKVTGKNQVTIPAALARELKITPGTRLEWSRGREGDCLRIRVRPSPRVVLQSVQEMVGAYHIDPGKALAKLAKMRAEDDPEHGLREMGK